MARNDTTTFPRQIHGNTPATTFPSARFSTKSSQKCSRQKLKLFYKLRYKYHSITSCPLSLPTPTMSLYNLKCYHGIHQHTASQNWAVIDLLRIPVPFRDITCAGTPHARSTIESNLLALLGFREPMSLLESLRGQLQRVGKP